MNDTSLSSLSIQAKSDASLCDDVADRIARPKVAAADSFILHAPLELLARRALLAYVRPAARERARARIAWLGDTFDAAGPGLDAAPQRLYDGPADAAARLLAAIGAGEQEDADACAAYLARTLSAGELAAALADDVIPRLAAAAHGSIFLFQLPRIAPRSRAAALMLRGLVRELVGERDWRLTWHQQRGSAARPSGDLIEPLIAPRSPGDPGSSFIYPIMSLVERSGLALEVLDAPTRGLSPLVASRQLARVAAWSMLQDEPEHAPYGWSHCLSMPQAVLGIADACSDPGAAVAVAATYVLGFRATLGKRRLDPGWQPEPPTRRDRFEGLTDSPDEAARVLWYAPAEVLPTLVTTLATRAAIHEDAHLAKYTLACLDAAAADPEAGRLFLAAAAYLSAWWAQRTPDQDPFLD